MWVPLPTRGSEFEMWHFFVKTRISNCYLHTKQTFFSSQSELKDDWEGISVSYCDSCCIKKGMKVKGLAAQSCLILCNPMDCSPSGSSAHGILQARILEWIAMPFSRGSFPSRDQTQVSCIAGRFFTVWATREAHIKACWYAKILLESLSKTRVTETINS